MKKTHRREEEPYFFGFFGFELNVLLADVAQWVSTSPAVCSANSVSLGDASSPRLGTAEIFREDFYLSFANGYGSPAVTCSMLSPQYHL